MYGKMQASGLTELFPFIGTSVSLANPVSLLTMLFAFPQLLSSHHGGGSTLWIIVLGALIHTWRQEVGDGCGISC